MKLTCSIPMILVAVSALAAHAANQEFPMYIGRSTSGTLPWSESPDETHIHYEILYFATVDNVEGWSNQVDCVLTKMTEGIFQPVSEGSPFVEMTSVYAEKVISDHAVANPDDPRNDMDMGGFSMSMSSGNFGSSSSSSGGGSDTLAGAIGDAEMENATDTETRPSLSTARSRQFPGDFPKPTIQEVYRQQSGQSGGSERGGTEYEMVTTLGLYINGRYVNRFEDIADFVELQDDAGKPLLSSRDLEDFLLEQAKMLVLPELVAEVPDDDQVVNSPFFSFELLDLWRGFDREVRMDCIYNESMQGDSKGVNPSIENTTIVGRVVKGDFEGQVYDLSIFFEFYKLQGADGELTTEQEQCFKDAVDSMIFTAPTPTSEEMTTDEEDVTRAMIQEEHDERNKRFIRNATFYDDSIYWDQSGAQVSLTVKGVTVSYQKGTRLTLNGKYMRAYADYATNPSGLEALVLDITSNADPIQEDLKHSFPVNGTSKLYEFFLPMMSGPIAHLSFKPKKDGTGIFPMLFVEHLLYCVNATALENWKDPYGNYDDEKEEDIHSQTGGVGLDVLVSPPPAVEELGGQDLQSSSAGENPDAIDAPVSDAGFMHTGMHGVLSILLLLLL